nr:LysR family transcriptional regulator [uncultured Hyphomonas sp.]
MNPLNLRSIDLNLLPILDAILEANSVTLASARINLSQSATSSALQRLRETFDDPIVIRRGQRMVPSSKALLIRDDLKAALDDIRDIVRTLKSDDTSSGRRILALSAPEHVHLTLSDAIRAVVNDEDNDLSIQISSFERRGIADQLQRGEIDIAVGAFGNLPKHFHRQALYDESMNVIMCKDHPLMKDVKDEHISLDDLNRYPHLVVSPNEDIEASHLSRWLLSKSVDRNVAVVVEHVSLVAEMLRNTKMICLGTERSLELLPAGKKFLASKKLPAELGDDTYTIEMIWHDRTDLDIDMQMTRETIFKCCQGIAPSN